MRFVIAFLFLAAPALAQPSAFLRALDDSDPDMKSLMVRFFDSVPCSERNDGLCEEAHGLLTGGGDRLAAYLIRQHEANEREGFPDRVTYLRLLGYTESRTAYDYLAVLTAAEAKTLRENPGLDPFALQTALEALGRTRDLRALPAILELLDVSDPGIQQAALNAADRVQGKHGPRAEVRAKLEQMQEVLARSDAPETTDRIALEDKIRRVLAQPGEIGRATSSRPDAQP
jgi:hypothetical protein